MPNTFVKIASVTVGSGGSSSIAFTSIPQTFTDLKIVLSCRSASGVAVAYTTYMKVNALTTSIYSNRVLEGSGSAASSFSQSGTDTAVRFSLINGTGATASTFASTEIYISNYTSSNFKSISVETVSETNATTIYSNLIAALVSTTAAITDLTFTNEVTAGNFAQYSTAVLYGIKSS